MVVVVVILVVMMMLIDTIDIECVIVCGKLRDRETFCHVSRKSTVVTHSAL